jgi:hypothetical protein
MGIPLDAAARPGNLPRPVKLTRTIKLPVVSRAAVTTAPAEAEPEVPAPSALLRYVRRVGYAVLAAELACFFAWSAVLYNHFSLTLDFAIYHQGWYLIAHGNLDPVSSVQAGARPFWQDHSEFILWPLALLYWIPPHDLMLLWLQDAGVVVAEAVAFTWICELAQKYRPGKEDAALLAGAGLVLLVANPWTWKAVSFDFHTETLAVAFLALLARDLANGRRRAWAWVVPLLACGDVAATYLVAIGIGGILAARRARLTGLAMTAIGLAALAVIHAVNGDQSSPLWGYGYLESPVNAPFSIGALLTGIAAHPAAVIRQLWRTRVPTWQNLSPSGVLGVGFAWILPAIIVVLLTDNLQPLNSFFAVPGFQSLPVYILVPVGTVAVLCWMARRAPLLAIGITAVVLVQALYWTVVYGPQTEQSWLRVPAPTASTLASVEARIPASDEVIASQGVVGRFSGRTEVHAFYGPGPSPMPLDGTRTWFVVVPDEGIETATPQAAMQLVSDLAGPMHGTLVTHANGVWVYTWTPPRGESEITLP